MPFSKQIWICGFCRRKKAFRKGVVVAHEAQCFKNSARTPYLGELTFTGQTGKFVNYGYDESIRDVWREWVEHDPVPDWWPGSPGMIWDGAKWCSVPGYVQQPPKPGHGCAGGAPCEDQWPSLNGEPLPAIRAQDRLAILAVEKVSEAA